MFFKGCGILFERILDHKILSSLKKMSETSAMTGKGTLAQDQAGNTHLKLLGSSSSLMVKITVLDSSRSVGSVAKYFLKKRIDN